MGQQFSELNTKHIEFIAQQKIYFVSTAAETGTVNLSPKGGDSLRGINSTTIAWLNHTGSGMNILSYFLTALPQGRFFYSTLLWCSLHVACRYLIMLIKLTVMILLNQQLSKVNLALKSIGLRKINKVLMVLILRLSNAQPCKRNRLQGTA